MTYVRRFFRHPGAPALAAGVVAALAVIGPGLRLVGYTINEVVVVAAIAIGVVNAAWAIRGYAQARRRYRQAELRHELARAARKEVNGD